MIAAVLLAAGESRRMGQPKLTLPWGETGSVIGHVVEVFHQAGADPIVVVTGADRRALARALRDTSVELVHNRRHRQGGMLSSIQAGLGHLEPGATEAALLAPADLPLLKAENVRAIIERRRQAGAELIAPSHARRRGHPVLVARPLWRELIDLAPGATLRDFLTRRAQQIDYVIVEDPGVIQDIDTPDDYRRGLGRNSG